MQSQAPKSPCPPRVSVAPARFWSLTNLEEHSLRGISNVAIVWENFFPSEIQHGFLSFPRSCWQHSFQGFSKVQIGFQHSLLTAQFLHYSTVERAQIWKSDDLGWNVSSASHQCSWTSGVSSPSLSFLIDPEESNRYLVVLLQGLNEITYLVVVTLFA